MRYFVIIFSVLSCVTAQAQIDLQTGSAQYSIPVFNYADPKSGVSHAIAVNYSSGQGIKVNQLSSNIGLGWSVMAGGEIARIQHGSAPDDQYNPDVTVNGLTNAQAEYLIYKKENPTLYNAYFPNGFLYKKYDINYLPKQIAFQPRFGDNDDNNYKAAPISGEDAEQDEFIVNINGIVKDFKIGKDFSIKYEDNTLWKTVIIKENIADKTLYNQNITTKIKGFTITDETGIKYTFDKYDLDELQQPGAISSYIGSSGYGSPNTSIEKGNGKYYSISKWMLTSITNSITGTSITFNYVQEDRQYFTSFLDQTSIDNDNTNSSPNYSRLIGNSHTITNILQQIIFPNGIKATFTTGTTGRLDLNGSYPLSKIEISNSIKIIKTVTFTTAYFNGSGLINGDGYLPVKRDETDASTMYSGSINRLALTGLSITGLSPINYFFSYYIGNINGLSYSVPSRMSKQRNLSGLYNPKYNYVRGGIVLDMYGAYPLDDGNTEITGLLKDIQTSTNNKVSYTYRLAQLSSIWLEAVLVDKITFSDLVTNTNYTKAYGYCISQSGNCPGTAILAHSAFYDNQSSNDVARNFVINHIQYNPSSNKKFGNYVFNGLSTQVSSFLRNPAVTFQLNAMITAVLQCNPYVALAIQIVGQEVLNVLTEWLGDVFNNQDQDLNYKIYYDHGRELSNPLPLTLAFVFEFDVVNNTSILRKTYYFNTAKSNNKILDTENGQNVEATKTFNESNMQRVKPGLIGNLAEVNYLDPQGNTVYNKKLTYTPNYQTSDNNYQSVYYFTKNYYSGSWNLTPTPYLSGGAIKDLWIYKVPYNFVTGNNYLTSQIETVSNSDNSATTTTTVNYGYDTKNNQPNQLYSTASDGKIKGTNTYYAIDYWDTYTSNTILSKQKQNNLVNTAVASLSWYKTSSTATSYNVTSITITTYDAVTLAVGSIKTSILSQPVVLTQTDINAFDPYATTGWITGVSFTTVQQNTYDNNYFLVQSNLNDNSLVNAVVYDYNTNLPAAKIVNSAYTDISYTSFESSNKDLLSYADAGITKDASLSVTGNYYYKLSAGTITRSTALSNTQKYTVTLWARNGSVTVNGSSGTSVAIKNGWTLYTFAISGIASLTIAGATTTYIDEVRLYPQNAQMVSQTYDPLIGITSTCDENNNLVYNEYDDAGRLSIVRDANKNIIKKMCYNNLYTSAACTDYGNSLVTKDFYGTCSCTSKSNGISYTVPANIYHSTISQEDADAQALNELTTSGQAKADAQPSCSALITQTLNYSNSSNEVICLSIYNVCTQKYLSVTSSLNPNTLGTIAQLPAGTYTINAKSCSSNPAPHIFRLDVPSFYQGNTVNATFSNVQLSATTTLTIY